MSGIAGRAPAERGDVLAIEEAVRDLSVPRRERIATAVLAGMAASPDPAVWRNADEADVFRLAVRWADALLAELDKA